jgi:hypothetical protein
MAVSLCCTLGPVYGQDVPTPMKEKIDSLVSKAYGTAAQEFPCRMKTRGKAHMFRWEEVDRCLNDAAARVDWVALGRQLQELRTSTYGISQDVFAAEVDKALSAHALAFDKVFTSKDSRARLPLTNSLLKFLPADSLLDLPVFTKADTQVGTFAGVFTYERSGGLSTANTFSLTYFQYKDAKGNMQSASDSLLLDSFGIPWKEAMSQRGFRLTTEKMKPKY